MIDGKTYRQTRDGWENQNKWIFEGEGEYGMPVIEAVHGTEADRWIPFNYALGHWKPGGGKKIRSGLHFYLDDYQFTRVWNYPDVYLNLLARFDAVAAPDFSTYLDFPQAIRIYNVFRNRWLAAWWQQNGIRVVPNVEWGTKEDFGWILDGQPRKSDIIVSSVGCLGNRESRKLWVEGFEEVLKRLEPEKVFLYGRLPEEAEGGGRIIRIEPFTERFGRERKE